MSVGVKKFFNSDYVNTASYDNIRKIASVIDGQKNAGRKILYTILEKNIKDEIKVSQLGSKIAEFTEYLHGSLDNVIVNLAQNFVGTNNVPMLVREGNFGSRFTQEASASRYIYTHGSPEFFKLFNKQDSAILQDQYFEGAKIEPRFFVPELPLLLINGSEGVSFGFAQKILPRSPKTLIKLIKDRIAGKKWKEQNIVPHYEGFKGTVVQGDSINQWLIKGCAQRTSSTKVTITEIPVGYDLKSYLEVLDALEEKKAIQSYTDHSENEVFKFEVSFQSKILKELNDDELLSHLKLIKKVSENYTVMDEFNKIRVFNNVIEILDHYITVKLDYLDKRKSHLLGKLQSDINIDQSKYNFIESIINGKLSVNNRKKDDVEKDLAVMTNIIQVDGSYDYLLNMNIMSLTQERMKKLKESLTEKKNELTTLKKMSTTDIWSASIDSLKL
jgi:DNA topoisomerase-2